MDFQTIIDLDKQLLLFFNGSESLFLDAMVTTLTNAWTWVPLYISLLIVVIKNSDSVLGVFLVLASAALCVLFTGTLDDTIVKPLVGRWRPTRDPEIGLFDPVDTLDDSPQVGNHGIVDHAGQFVPGSGHDGRLIVDLPDQLHYLLQLLLCHLLGSAQGLYRYYSEKWTCAPRYTSLAYTRTGYHRNDADIPVCVLMFTLIYATFRACLA